MGLPTGICIGLTNGIGKDSGDGSICTPATSQFVQKMITKQAQAGIQVLTVSEMYAMTLQMANGNTEVATACQNQYAGWLKMVIDAGDTRFSLDG